VQEILSNKLKEQGVVAIVRGYLEDGIYKYDDRFNRHSCKYDGLPLNFQSPDYLPITTMLNNFIYFVDDGLHNQCKDKQFLLGYEGISYLPITSPRMYYAGVVIGKQYELQASTFQRFGVTSFICYNGLYKSVTKLNFAFELLCSVRTLEALHYVLPLIKSKDYNSYIKYLLNDYEFQDWMVPIIKFLLPYENKLNREISIQLQLFCLKNEIPIPSYLFCFRDDKLKTKMFRELIDSEKNHPLLTHLIKTGFMTPKIVIAHKKYSKKKFYEFLAPFIAAAQQDMENTE
jgi:hypothetical protein